MWMHAAEGWSVCVCVDFSENAFPVSPLVGWKRAINSRVSPGSSPATGSDSFQRREKKGGGGIFVSLIISQARQTTLAGQRGERRSWGGGAGRKVVWGGEIGPLLLLFGSF